MPLALTTFSHLAISDAMKKYLVELIGTFFLVLTVCTSVAFGAALLSGFKVVTEEIDAEPVEPRAQGRPRLRLATG